MVDYVLKMLTQPSSYAGLAGIAGGLGIAQPAYSVISGALAAIFGAVAFFVDGGKLTN